MKRYAYGFSWDDKEGKAQKMFIEASSRAEATDEFIKTTGVNIMTTDVDMVRQRW